MGRDRVQGQALSHTAQGPYVMGRTSKQKGDNGDNFRPHNHGKRLN